MSVFPGTCRIWDKKKEEWIQAKVVIEPVIGNVWNPEFKLGRCEEYPDCITQYFTGQHEHESHGRQFKIYEGDIVEGYWEDGTVRSRFVIKWNNEACKFNLSRDLIRSRKLKVIGNIIEHSDLIPVEHRERVLTTQISK